MARTRPSTRPPTDAVGRLYQAHVDEAAAERNAALSDAAREAHDQAWAAHFTALNTHRQADRLRDMAGQHRRSAGWHDRQRPDRRQYDRHPRTGEVVFLGDYLREVADEHDAAAVAAVARAAEHHARGAGHSARGRDLDEPIRAAARATAEAEARLDAEYAVAAKVAARNGTKRQAPSTDPATAS
jgi:hypothetical protein